MRMSEDDLERLANSIARALQQARSVSDSEHYDHHVWITQKIIAERLRAEFWGSLKEHVAKWGAVSIVSVTGYALWLWFKQQVQT